MIRKDEAASDKITWIASYPKSGNTWVRSLLQAYRCNGYVDINDLHTGVGDSAECYMRAVSPIPIKDLGMHGQLQLRPAALLHALIGKPVPRYFKTHFANLKEPGIPAYIPRDFTARAIYIIRDPRDVLISFCNFYNCSLRKGVEGMAKKDFWIGGDGQSFQIISSWSNHVASWGGESDFPVHFVKYEDLMANPDKELTEMLTFIGIKVDHDRVKRAVQACEISRLQKTEQEEGFTEHPMGKTRGDFFNGGGSRWDSELGQKWVSQIESDHVDIMRSFGYLNNVVELNAEGN